MLRFFTFYRAAYRDKGECGVQFADVGACRSVEYRACFARIDAVLGDLGYARRRREVGVEGDICWL